MSKDIYERGSMSPRGKWALVGLGLLVALAVTARPNARGGDERLESVIALVGQTATLDCEFVIVSERFNRKGICTPETHGIMVMKSDAGLDFIDRMKGSVIASVYTYSIDGEPQRRVWQRYPTALADAETAFGEIR